MAGGVFGCLEPYQLRLEVPIVSRTFVVNSAHILCVPIVLPGLMLGNSDEKCVHLVFQPLSVEDASLLCIRSAV